eukprot:TRINITY_DN20616_c0_g1_i1.p2 TRINITY_DN20616_c0_g1~~TRINITY_DN20616_c0_g1_i1.p2  ORF type:complete len:126 (-),score=29.83 TRINITY_DN20616_c0_g1_i1:464-841(-)
MYFPDYEWLMYGIFFFFKQKTAYEMLRSLVGSEMCIRDRDERPGVPLLLRRCSDRLSWLMLAHGLVGKSPLPGECEPAAREAAWRCGCTSGDGGVRCEGVSEGETECESEGETERRLVLHLEQRS